MPDPESVAQAELALLRADLDRRMAAIQADIDRRFASQEKAVEKAEQALAQRLNGMNEFRQEISDQAKAYLSRNEYNSAHEQLRASVEAVDGRVSEIRADLGKVTGARSGSNATTNVMLAAIGVVLTLMAIALAVHSGLK